MNKKIEDISAIEIITGQIMSRVTAKEISEDEVQEVRKVLVPKAINSDGSVSVNELPEETLKVKADEKRITVKGDIVMKLSTPYDAALIEEESEGCIVPSFCAIVKNNSDIDNDYLLAFLNSKECKSQLSAQVAGAVMTVLSVGKVRNVCIPIPDISKQKEIGKAFKESQEKIRVIKKIMELESQRNDAMFKELTSER